MKTRFILLFFSILLVAPVVAGVIYSFEDGQVPSVFKVRKGSLSISSDRSKLGNSSLRWNWVAGDTLVAAPVSMNTSSIQVNGGINMWIYNEQASSEKLVLWFGEYEHSTTRSCKLEVKLNFKGWRCVWARFRADMGHPGFTLRSTKWIAPATGSGTFYVDFLEFVNDVSWERISDMQYRVNNSSSELEDFVAVRTTPAPPPAASVSESQREALRVIRQRIDDWHLGKGDFQTHPVFVSRRNAFNSYVQNAVNRSSELSLSVAPDGSVRGPGIFPMDYYNTTVENEAVQSFRSVNERFLVQLAYNARKNNSTSSRDLLLKIFGWYYDQGWADGSAMGRLRFEMLRSSGFFHSAYLMRDAFPESQFDQVMNAMNWFTLFGKVYATERDAGESADQIRTQLLPKLFYAASMKDEKAQLTAMNALLVYANNAVTPAPGYLDCLKPDYSGYHHRGVYFNAYYPDALYSASLMYYFLSGTDFQMSEASFQHLKNALLTFGFVCAGYDVPGGVTGRFPTQTEVLDKLLPAYAYLALSRETPDAELTAFFKKMWQPSVEPMLSHVARVRSDITFKNTPGEVEMMLRLANVDANAVKVKSSSDANPASSGSAAAPFAAFHPSANIHLSGDLTGTMMLPFSGMLVSRGSNWVLSAKGFSKYIWDFESSSTENLYGRYLSYGHTDLSMVSYGRRSYRPEHLEWDWSHLPGTTAKYLSKEQLNSQNSPNDHRNFSDETFLGGIAFDARSSVFANHLHDNTFDKGFYARKSIVQFDSVYTFLGSGIKNSDRNTFVHTTLFQNQKVSGSDLLKVDGAAVVSAQTALVNPVIRDNYGNGYVVHDGSVDLSFSNSFISAFINHGRVMTNGTYYYQLVIAPGDADLAQLANPQQSPVQVLRNDETAHIVAHPASGATAAVVFDVAAPVNAGRLYSLSLPGIAVLKEKNGVLELAISNPDMNRPAGANISALSSAAVRDPGTAMRFEVVLNGWYEALSFDTGVSVSQGADRKTTVVIDESKEGNTYRLKLRLPATSVEQPGENDNGHFRLIPAQKGEYLVQSTNELPFTVTLFTLDGKSLEHRENCLNDSLLTTQQLSPGVYLLSLSSKTGRQNFRLIR